MSDAVLTALIGAGTALVTASGAFARWALKLWAQVRREAIKAQQVAAEQQRADNARMVDALLAQARSNAELAGRLDQLAGKLDTLIEWRDPQPGDDERRARRTSPNGFRAQRAQDSETE
jgi:hypothetical protein